MLPDLYGPWPVAGYEVRVDLSDRVRLVAAREGKPLRALPPSVREHPDMAWIRLSLEAAKEHHRNLRGLLERAMVEDIRLAAEDLALLALDPVGRPILGSVLMQVDGIVGLPVPEHWAMETLSGDLIPLGAPATVPHPVRLQSAGKLEAWNRWYNGRWFRQPFRQIRRQVYTVRPEESGSIGFTDRFAGVCIRWDQARAILEKRGWSRVTKTGAERHFDSARLTAHLEFRTPARRGFGKEHVVVNRLFFLPRGDRVINKGRPGIPLERVPPVTFSEAMRDADAIA